MAGVREFETSIPRHKPRVRTFVYEGGRRPIKIVDRDGVLDPAEIHPDGSRIMKSVAPSENGKRIIVTPINESTKSPSNS